MNHRRKFYKTKRFKISLGVIIFLICFRIALPYIVKSYVNKTLANIPNYYGHVENIDLSLLRGAYTINNLFLNKVNAQTQVPFLNLEKTDISVQWKSLFKGEIVSEIIMEKPSFIYVFEDHKKATTSETETEDWSKALTNLVPIDINHLKITNGKLAFVQVNANPNIDLNMTSVNLEATNLRNVNDKEIKLPSTLNATAISIGSGKFKMNGKMNIVKEIPDMDISFSLEDANIKSLNDLTKHYTAIDFSEGTYGVYSEMAINNGYFKGYIKPILKNTNLISKEDSLIEGIWEGFVGFFKFILKNQKQDTLATKVPLEGDLNNVQTKIWPSLSNIFKNAWIKAFKDTTDDTINFSDANPDK